MVQRWDIGRDRGLGVFMEHDEFGEYVELKDYYALEERLAALEVMIDAAKLAGCTFVQKAPYTESSVECWVHDAERDRLAAENAELLESLAEYAHAVGAGHPSPCTLGPLCPYCHIDGIDEQLAAANATIDKLRDLLPEGGVWCYACNRATVPVWGEEPYEHIDPKYNQMKTTFRCSICKRDTHAKDSCVDTLRAILHPQPETPNDSHS